MEKARVSVIMNCFNGERDLAAALESVSRQTFTDFEIIFWDNCSTDQSADIARVSDRRLRYFRAESKTPLGEARNLALSQATGDYLAFLDCDDLWRPDKLARQVALFESNPRLGLVCTDTEIFDGKRVLARVFSRATPERGQVFAGLLQRQWISMSSAMLSRKALESVAEAPGVFFDPRLCLCEEADLFYRIAHDWELDYIPEALTVWRVHGKNSTFRHFGNFAAETRLILEKQCRLYPDFEAKHAGLAAMLRRRANFQEAVALWRDGKGHEARALIPGWAESSAKERLFRLASYLPGVCFDLAARCYFALPKNFRH